MCPGTVACDPVRNISLLFHVTQLWPMAFAHFQPAPRCCGTDFPFGFVRQRPSLSSRVSWRRICLRSRTCSIGGSNFFFIVHGHSVLVHLVYFVIDVRSVGSRQSMLLFCLSVPPGQSLFLLWRLVALLSSYCVFTPFGCFTPCYHCCLAYDHDDMFLVPFCVYYVFLICI